MIPLVRFPAEQPYDSLVFPTPGFFVVLSLYLILTHLNLICNINLEIAAIYIAAISKLS